MAKSAIMCSALLLCISVVTSKVAEHLIRPFIKGFLYLTFGTMNAERAYKSLPDDCVEHIVAKNDGVIKDRAGIHESLRQTNRIKKTEYRTILLKNNNAAARSVALANLLNLKDCKVRCDLSCREYSNDEGTIAHNENLCFMQTYHKARGHSGNPQISGNQVLENKIKRLFNLN